MAYQHITMCCIINWFDKLYCLSVFYVLLNTFHVFSVIGYVLQTSLASFLVNFLSYAMHSLLFHFT